MMEESRALGNGDSRPSGVCVCVCVRVCIF
jgi:hypothetical protein